MNIWKENYLYLSEVDDFWYLPTAPWYPYFSKDSRDLLLEYWRSCYTPIHGLIDIMALSGLTLDFNQNRLSRGSTLHLCAVVVSLLVIVK